MTRCGCYYYVKSRPTTNKGVMWLYFKHFEHCVAFVRKSVKWKREVQSRM